MSIPVGQTCTHLWQLIQSPSLLVSPFLNFPQKPSAWSLRQLQPREVFYVDPSGEKSSIGIDIAMCPKVAALANALVCLRAALGNCQPDFSGTLWALPMLPRVPAPASSLPGFAEYYTPTSARAGPDASLAPPLASKVRHHSPSASLPAFLF